MSYILNTYGGNDWNKKKVEYVNFLLKVKYKFNFNTVDDNFIKYDLDPDKSLDFKNDVIFSRNEKTLSSCDYEM